MHKNHQKCRKSQKKVGKSCLNHKTSKLLLSQGFQEFSTAFSTVNQQYSLSKSVHSKPFNTNTLTILYPTLLLLLVKELSISILLVVGLGRGLSPNL